MTNNVTQRSQLQFTPTPELRQIIETEASRNGLSVSAFIRTKLLGLFREEIEQLKQQQSNDGNRA